MGAADTIPTLLAAAWLIPLASFALIVFFGPRMGKKGVFAGHLATTAIVSSCVASVVALILWLANFGPIDPRVRSGHGEAGQSGEHAASGAEHESNEDHDSAEDEQQANHGEEHFTHGAEAAAHEEPPGLEDQHPTAAALPKVLAGDWYTLGEFGSLRVSIGYYVDALTVAMFAMITFIASCIHFYATGYMHDELHDVHDHEVILANGHHLHRPGRFYRFFQYLSLFCFSMLGLVVAGNIAMVFVFWELVGICSYFLIGFYIERKSASNAANKAFIVNRVGDFGMIIGLMALWGGLGTFAFGDYDGRQGIFSQVRRPDANFDLAPPDGVALSGAAEEIDAIHKESLTHLLLGTDVSSIVPSDLEMSDGTPSLTAEEIAEAKRQIVEARKRIAVAEGALYSPEGKEAVALAKAASGARVASEVDNWRKTYGTWLLVVAGVGIFCGCVGKSAQFPLHVWLPDAMEGPTPVSALVHSATMVAAGVYLVGRFYPVFTPDVLLVIAIVGGITLFLAATIAITATDIKRVLAYSTVSQLGYMMLALGLGGWIAGLFHLITHAFFKSLLFLCSGSVIHACHTNEMPKMGGLRRKMPYTAYTMLVGCLAIIGAVFFSGFYSKDAIVAQALSFWELNPIKGALTFAAAAGGASLTAFYMFRLWYMTFAGEPRDAEIFAHAHESPRVMYIPLVILSVFAIGVGWTLPLPWFALVAILVVAGAAGFWLKRNDASGAPGSTKHSGGHADAGHSHVSLAAHGQEDHHHGDSAHGHEHAEHESGPSYWRPLGIAACLVAAAIVLPLWLGSGIGVESMLEQARYPGALGDGTYAKVHYPNEHAAHDFHTRATLIASATALAGFLLATATYCFRLLDPAETRRQFQPVYRFLLKKWYFDELYAVLFVKPVHAAAAVASRFDRELIDGFLHRLAIAARGIARFDDLIDRYLVDGLVNLTAQWTYSMGLFLKNVQTGRLRQYVLFIVVGVVALSILIGSFAFAR